MRNYKENPRFGLESCLCTHPGCPYFLGTFKCPEVSILEEFGTRKLSMVR
jgi:hypothetical protein